MPSQRKKSDKRIDTILEWTKTGLEWGQKITSVVPVPAYGLVSDVLLALIEQVAVRIHVHPFFRLFIPLIQVARTNKGAAATVLENIQRLVVVFFAQSSSAYGENSLNIIRSFLW